MVMKQGFTQNQTQQQKQVQRLAMTQTLQQSIQMLQYNAEELQNFLKQKEMDNPLITVEVAEERPLSKVSKNSDTHETFMNQIASDTEQSLFDYLLDQVHLTMRDTPLRKLVLFLLDYVDQNGYLRITEDEIKQKTQADDIAIMDAVTLLQQLDPPGVGARTLQESLMLQTENDEGSPEIAYMVLEESFDDLVDRNWEKIAQRYDITLAEVQEVFDYVRTLTPNPGAGFGKQDRGYITPDLIFKLENGEPRLIQSKASRPRVSFSQEYFEQLRKKADDEVSSYVNEKKREYDWIAKSLTQRQDTILRVGKIIFERQQDFFLQKSKELSPLMLRDVANKLHLHESTVSRAVNGKYIATPFGTFELRSFFSNAVNQTSDVSADAAKLKIKEIIDQEDKEKPISDAKIEKQLKAQGVTISRRTVAKYREALGIPSSSKRKRYLEK
ncbi:RNA polymerase factor sigma-54 [Pediococcus acidilactici]|uniref:RNA polymerase factor sigma-54 n=1 Tax=Pediococcus acidilactici TaxID=1254 RepID=UPI0007B697BD|nr:RNA polymerase factor sigma-54 [Pediococcus acidilactici]KZX38637.1 RNA polymerase sigma-54 factor [Pediococcus acidilactici]KZX38849.1 RNA polymerase sigma-54 factor [Pediococcus acidilactici]OAC45754.1 RNA polymerase sigma-54 factor [Pediococcus acidilactici]QHS02439.1 RNA polymerase factor sigma-54 [Pediococcus acidilactici]